MDPFLDSGSGLDASVAKFNLRTSGGSRNGSIRMFWHRWRPRIPLFSRNYLAYSQLLVSQTLNLQARAL